MERPSSFDHPSPFAQLCLWLLLAVFLSGVVVFGWSYTTPEPVQDSGVAGMKVDSNSPGRAPKTGPPEPREILTDLQEIADALGVNKAQRLADLSQDEALLATASAKLGALESSHPDVARVHFYRGLERLMAGDSGASVEALERSLELDESNRGSWLTLSAVHAESEQYEEAERVLRRFLEIFPREIAGWDNLGQILWLQGRQDEAKRAYGEGLKLQGKTLVSEGPV